MIFSAPAALDSGSSPPTALVFVPAAVVKTSQPGFPAFQSLPQIPQPSKFVILAVENIAISLSCPVFNADALRYHLRLPLISRGCVYDRGVWNLGSARAVVDGGVRRRLN
jgi:hypothetical protein